MKIHMVGARNIPATHGGLERAAEELSAELVENSHVVVAHVDGSGVVTSDYRGIQLHGVKAVRTKHLHAATQVAASMPAALSSRPDIVHFHGVGPGVFSVVSATMRQPSVLTVQGIDWKRDKWSPLAKAIFRFAAKSTLRFPTEVIAVSKALSRTLRDSYNIRAHYIPNGVRIPEPVTPGETLDRFGLSAGDYILFVGRLVPEKDVHTLLKAHKRMAGNVPLVIVGTGANSYATSYENDLKAAATGSTIFTGHQSGTALAELYSNAGCYVLPSVMEGLPLGLLEAMSYGLPVLHSAISECTEVTDGGGGLTFPPGDDAKLCHLISELFNDKRGAQQMGRLGLSIVRERYAWPAIARDTVEVYEGALRR